MEIKQALFKKLLYHFQDNSEWSMFFRAILEEIDWSIYEFTHYTDEDNGDYLGFNVNYSEINRFPLLFGPGSYFNFRYALSLYKVTANAEYTDAVAIKLNGYTDHWVNKIKFLDEQNAYSPYLRYCFPYTVDHYDKLFRGTLYEVASQTETPVIRIINPDTDIIGDIYCYSNKTIVLKEPSNFTLAQLQSYENRIVYRRDYDFNIIGSLRGAGYTPNHLPSGIFTDVIENNNVIFKFIADSVSARIDIPIISL